MSGILANDMEARGLLKPSFNAYSVTFVTFYHSTQSQDSRVDRLCFSLESESVICSVVSNSFTTPCSGACQIPLSMEFSRQKILEWAAIPFSKVSSLTQGSNLGLLHCRQILYHLSHQVAKNWESSFPTLPERVVLSPLLNPVPWFLYLHLFLAVPCDCLTHWLPLYILLCQQHCIYKAWQSSHQILYKKCLMSTSQMEGSVFS